MRCTVPRHDRSALVSDSHQCRSLCAAAKAEATSPHLPSLAINNEACDNTPSRLAVKHAGAAVNIVAKVNAGHGHCVNHQAALRCLKGIDMVEGEEGGGLEDCM